MTNSVTQKLPLIISLLILGLIILIPDVVFAQGTPFDSVTEKGEESVSWITGSFMKIIGTIAVVALAVGMGTGKLDWRIAVTVIAAIIIGFNAGNIVEAFM